MRRHTFLSFIFAIFVVTLVQSPADTSNAFAYSASCSALHQTSPSAPDGQYTISPKTGQEFSVYCYGMQTGSPKEYLSLIRTGGSYNFSKFNNYHGKPANSFVKISFNKVRIDPTTLTVDINDFAFSTRTYSDPSLTDLIAYGVAGDCAGNGDPTGVGNIDLTGTPFAVNSKFVVDGWYPNGSVKVEGNTVPITPGTGSSQTPGDWAFVTGKVVDLKGGGYAGAIGPEGSPRNDAYLYFGNWIHDATPFSTPVLTLSLSLFNGTCGSANAGKYATAPSTDLCTLGAAGSVTGSGPWYWSCNGINGGTNASCSATKITDGTCGSANGTTVSRAPSANLCATGTTGAVSGSGPWNWSCSGTNGGSTASCSANLQGATTNGTCGSANGTTVTSAPSTNLCTTGTTGAVSGYGPWSWLCTGTNGGTSASCNALVSGKTGIHDGIVNPAPGKTGPDYSDTEDVFLHILGLRQLTPTQLGSADVAPLGADGKPVGNGTVDVADLVMMMRRAARVTNW